MAWVSWGGCGGHGGIPGGGRSVGQSAPGSRSGFRVLSLPHTPICVSCALPSTTARTKPLMSSSLSRPPSRFLRISSGSCLGSGGGFGGSPPAPPERPPGAGVGGARVPGTAIALGLRGKKTLDSGLASVSAAMRTCPDLAPVSLRATPLPRVWVPLLGLTTRPCPYLFTTAALARPAPGSFPLRPASPAAGSRDTRIVRTLPLAEG